jgi:gas vesicle protein
MGRPEEFGDLFDAATRNTPVPASVADGPMQLVLKAASPVLRPLLNDDLPRLTQLLVEFERHRQSARRVDGSIIGTGEADFTKGNTTYTLNYRDKTFLLVDVPGIEGDEARYVDEVRKAIARAHLVFYVNGTHKKPERATAEKIRSYLRRGTKVCPLFNVRGSADAYEFEEDRLSLAQQGGAGAALEQTVEVLESVLGTDVLLSGHCVQGLLAFSSLAYDAKTASTTIDLSRNRDLVIQQRNYLKYFDSTRQMYEFSQIKAVAQVLHSRIDTFRDDIVESNKIKVRELLAENLAVLHECLDGHRTFMLSVEPEFEKCRSAFKESLKTFERLVYAGRMSMWVGLFNDLNKKADDIVAEHFGEGERIQDEISQAYKNLQESAAKGVEKNLEDNIEQLQQLLQQAMTRLIEDVQRVEFQQRVDLKANEKWALESKDGLGWGLGLLDFGSMAFQIGSYAMAGFGIGSAFPGVGNAIGAAVGAAIGLFMSLVSLVMGKEKRIRKAQSQVRAKIEEVQEKVLNGLEKEVSDLVAMLKGAFYKDMLSQVNELYNSLRRPEDILERQIAMMTKLKENLEKMPYGTIQAVQY